MAAQLLLSDAVNALLCRAAAVISARLLGTCFSAKSQRQIAQCLRDSSGILSAEHSQNLQRAAGALLAPLLSPVEDQAKGVDSVGNTNKVEREVKTDGGSNVVPWARAVSLICTAAAALLSNDIGANAAVAVRSADMSMGNVVGGDDAITTAYESLARATAMLPCRAFPQLFVWTAELALRAAATRDKSALHAHEQENIAIDLLLDALTAYEDDQEEEVEVEVEAKDGAELAFDGSRVGILSGLVAGARSLAYEDYRMRAYLTVSVLLRSAAARAENVKTKCRLINEAHGFAKDAVALQTAAPHAWAVLGNAWNHVYVAGDTESGIKRSKHAFSRTVQAYSRALLLWEGNMSDDDKLKQESALAGADMEAFLLEAFTVSRLEAKREVADSYLNRASARIYEGLFGDALSDLAAALDLYTALAQPSDKVTTPVFKEASEGCKQSLVLKTALMNNLASFHRALDDARSMMSRRAVEAAAQPLRKALPDSSGKLVCMERLFADHPAVGASSTVSEGKKLLLRVIGSVEQVMAFGDDAFVVLDAQLQFAICVVNNRRATQASAWCVGDIVVLPLNEENGVNAKKQQVDLGGKTVGLDIVYVDSALCKATSYDGKTPLKEGQTKMHEST